MISGVGSMLIGAKAQGYEIVGNIEWRPYYHTGTFEHNFPGSFMVKRLQDLTPEQLEACQDLDLMIGHTECGNFSNMRRGGSTLIENKEMGDIPEFIEAINHLKPKFFAMDNLPKSLLVADWKFYAEALPEYEIHFEWISNHGYGNLQKFRNRLFVIGAKKGLNFNFIPSEFEHTETVRDRISKISPTAKNHNLLDENLIYPSWGRYQFDPSYAEKNTEENRITLGEFKEFIREAPCNSSLKYYNKKGIQNTKIGFCKVNIDRHALTITGGGQVGDSCYRGDTLNPFTIRERASIQGCPDDFEFFPQNVYKSDKTYLKLIKQTGKFMPVEFCTFLTRQIQEFLDGVRDENTYTRKRVLKTQPIIDESKVAYCTNVGYGSEDICKFCGSEKFCKAQPAEELKQRTIFVDKMYTERECPGAVETDEEEDLY